jgi:hypothetical protein
MAERSVTAYSRLFEVRLLHHYWLDEGNTVFDLIASQAEREHRLLTYDARRFLDIEPTVATTKHLDGLGCVFRATALGCVAAAPASTVIPADTVLEFALTVRDASFYNYTALTLRPQRIYELYYAPEKKLYRYKENVPVLANLSGASRGTGPGKTLFLSTEIPATLAADDLVESFVLSGGALLQLTGDQPGGTTQQLGAQATDLPVFVHQGDVPPIVPPAGLTGAPARGVEISGDMPDPLFALIRLTAVRANDGDFSFIDGAGLPRTPHPVFHVRFKNRSAFWRYFDKSTLAPISTEPNALPLTRFGNAGTKQKPSEGLIKAIRNGPAISRLVADIFE